MAIVLGAALAVSMGANLFAATAAFTALRGPARVEQTREEAPRRPSARELIRDLSPAARAPVREALRAAAQRARPEFQASRDARRQAIAAAEADPFDPARVATLLDQARAAEARGRQALEAEAVAILGTLGPADRAVLAPILNGRGYAKPDRSGRREGPPAG
ncbi:periplasmic heavy metal sensor [Brevundimonas sp. LM2]|uniref:periplasmic heavy metal sensor n=1 Tax=Brevundimonas sp. LM2 TaxID=1938605 RepID=UPI001C0C0516|nr:periplasmic heavy metal sensor [Brevundimonas sp. LM2]